MQQKDGFILDTRCTYQVHYKRWGPTSKKIKKGFPAAKTVPIEMFTYQQLRILERSLLIMIAFILEQPIFSG